MFGWLTKLWFVARHKSYDPFAQKPLLSTSDPLVAQALEDQSKAAYPGCPRGKMHCVAFCECVFTKTPSGEWLQARLVNLRKRENCKHLSTGMYFPMHFPMGGGQDSQKCLDCGLVRLGHETEWKERE